MTNKKRNDKLVEMASIVYISVQNEKDSPDVYTMEALGLAKHLCNYRGKMKYLKDIEKEINLSTHASCCEFMSAANMMEEIIAAGKVSEKRHKKQYKKNLADVAEWYDTYCDVVADDDVRQLPFHIEGQMDNLRAYLETATDAEEIEATKEQLVKWEMQLIKAKEAVDKLDNLVEDEDAEEPCDMHGH